VAGRIARVTNDLPLFEDDRHEPGVFEASHIHQEIDVPRAAVLCFFNEVLDDLAASGELTPIYTLRSEIGRNPLYRLGEGPSAVAVAHPGVGAPLAAGFTEELAALGVRTFVACGGAGALVEGLTLGHVMVVDSALRDEGTSFHYLAPSRVVEADETGVACATAALREHGITHLVGRTWTTDALFRETRSRVDRRVAEGCQMVDMESSAFMAVARFRGLRFAQLLYAGDTLSGEAWDSRGWTHASDVRLGLFRAAVTTAQLLVAAD
jgi:uridine phosphorylase